jgi:hypothetical protein
MPQLKHVAEFRASRLTAKEVEKIDFSDLQSQQVLAAAARAVARELGREAAREYFAESLKRSRDCR